MIVVLHIIVLCRFTLRSYAGDVLPVSYAWSTFTGPVSGEVHEVQPWKEGSSQSSSYSEYGEGESHGGPDYVAKPDYSFSYGVDNPNTGDSHGHSETREGSLVTGEYSVMEPGGVLRHVLYSSDPKNGFRASVRYVQPDGETSSHEHGYHDDPHGGHAADHDDHERFPGPPSAPPYTSEYSSDDHEPYASQSPSSSFGYDGYNGVGGDVGGDGGTSYEDLPSPSTFKFPSPSGPFFKESAADTDSDDYDGNSENYDHWGNTFDSPPPPSLSSSSPYAGQPPSPFGQPPSPFNQPSLPFGQPSSPSPSFGLGPGPSSRPSPISSLSRRLPSTPPPPCAPPKQLTAVRSQPPPSSSSSSSSMMANIVASYQASGSDQSNGGRGGRVKSAKKENDDDDDDADSEPYRSLAAEFDVDDDDDNHGDLENHEADNDDDGTVDVSDRNVKFQQTPKLQKSSSSSSTPAQRPRSSSDAVTSSPSTTTTLTNLSPSPTITDYEPTIIDIATSTRYGLYNNH